MRSINIYTNVVSCAYLKEASNNKLDEAITIEVNAMRLEGPLKCDLGIQDTKKLKAFSQTGESDKFKAVLYRSTDTETFHCPYGLSTLTEGP